MKQGTPLNQNENMTIFDLGIPDVPTYKVGQVIRKADAPKVIGKVIPWLDLKKYEGKLVAKFRGAPCYDDGSSPWFVVKIIKFNGSNTEEATKFYRRNPTIEMPEHLTQVEYPERVSDYIRNICMPAPLRSVWSVVERQPNVWYTAKHNEELSRIDMEDYDAWTNFFAELRG